MTHIVKIVDKFSPTPIDVFRCSSLEAGKKILAQKLRQWCEGTDRVTFRSPRETTLVATIIDSCGEELDIMGFCRPAKEGE